MLDLPFFGNRRRESHDSCEVFRGLSNNRFNSGHRKAPSTVFVQVQFRAEAYFWSSSRRREIRESLAQRPHSKTLDRYHFRPAREVPQRRWQRLAWAVRWAFAMPLQSV